MTKYLRNNEKLSRSSSQVLTNDKNQVEPKKEKYFEEKEKKK